jgi:hypothetical protein
MHTRFPSWVQEETSIRAFELGTTLLVHHDQLPHWCAHSKTMSVGERYSAMWTTNGTFTCTGHGGMGVVSLPDAGNFNTEIYSTFLQSDYSFGATVLPDRWWLAADACSPVVMRFMA